jgi:hypothetical protein
MHPCRQLCLLVLYVMFYVCTNKDYRLQIKDFYHRNGKPVMV